MKYAAFSAAVLLSGCMTIDKLPTASTYEVFDAACMSKTTPFEVQQAALQELTRRGQTCREVAAQVLQIRAANPQVFAPAQPTQQPYFMPTRPPSADYRREAPATPSGIVGTLHSQADANSVSGQRAYICTYSTTNGLASVTIPATQGPCPARTTLR